jgi:hypothetical protein
MNFPSKVKPGSKSTTALWRTNKLCQFCPNLQAVKELLGFLGFNKIIQLEPEIKSLEKRYYKGERVTFIASRA